jgi:DUF1365 family protein
MRSKIYEGFVEHIRVKPASHRLRYPWYFYCINLDELPDMDKRLPLSSITGCGKPELILKSV